MVYRFYIIIISIFNDLLVPVVARLYVGVCVCVCLGWGERMLSPVSSKWIVSSVLYHTPFNV